MTFPIPNAALDDRLAFVGTSGSGKTYAMLGALAKLLKSGSRMIGVDALGVMWGLRLLADGKMPSGFDVVIFGGPHGDLPINEHSGALIGETVATMRESCILDLSGLGADVSERRFMLAFLATLYRKVRKDPVHLIFDEAEKTAGLLDIPRPGCVGLAEGASFNELSTGEARDKMLSVLSGAQRKLVDAMIDGQAMTREALAKATDYSAGSGGFNNLIGSLCTIGILKKPAPGMVDISEWALEVLTA